MKMWMASANICKTMLNHAKQGGDVNDPEYNNKLILQYGFAVQLDQNIGVKGGAGMLEWAGTSGIVSGVKGLVSAVKNARNLYRMYRAGKAANKVAKGFRASIKSVDDITESMVQEALKGAKLSTKQSGVSLPMVKRYYKYLLDGKVCSAYFCD